MDTIARFFPHFCWMQIGHNRPIKETLIARLKDTIAQANSARNNLQAILSKFPFAPIISVYILTVLYYCMTKGDNHIC